MKLNIDIIYEIFIRCNPHTQYTITSKIFKRHNRIYIESIPNKYRFDIMDLDIFSYLTELNMSYTSNISFKSIINLEYLKKLNISYNEDAFDYFFNQGIETLKKLNSLEISNTSKNISILTNLNELSIHRDIGSSDFINLPQLKKLVVQSTRVNLPYFSNLEYLSIGTIYIPQLSNIYKNSGLRVLNIDRVSDLYTGQIPLDDPIKLTGLEYLKLSSAANSIDTIYESKKLKALYVEYVQPMDICKELRYTLKYLSVLDINLIDRIGSTDFTLPNLIYLDCIYTHNYDISKISKKIKYLNICVNFNLSVKISHTESLEYLCIYGDPYVSIDIALVSLKNLKYLRADQQKIPLEFGDNSNLEYLMARCNSELTAKKLLKLTKLKYLEVFNCIELDVRDALLLKNLEALIWFQLSSIHHDLSNIISQLPKLKYYHIISNDREISCKNLKMDKGKYQTHIDDIYMEENGEDLRIMNGCIPGEFD